MNAQTQTAEVVPIKNLPTVIAGGPVRALVPQDIPGAWQIAGYLHDADTLPYGIKTRSQVMIAIMHGLEIGLPPMQAIQSIAVINNKPTLYGDTVIGLVRTSGLLEWIKETIEGTGDEQTARCVVKRKGEVEPITGEFSVADAKVAGLWGKRGKSGEPTPWVTYPKRMLKFRARAFAMRDGFADVLKGMHIREEVEDYDKHGPENAKLVGESGPPDPPPPQTETKKDETPAPKDDGPPDPPETAKATVEAEIVDDGARSLAELYDTAPAGTVILDDGPPDPDPLDIPADLRRASPQTERLKSNLLRDIETLESIDDFMIWSRDAGALMDKLPTADRTEVETAFTRRQETVQAKRS